MSDYTERLNAVNQSVVFTNIKGKEYAQVNQRILAFWSLFPDGRIVTRKLADDGKRCDFEAAAYADRESDKPIATGHAFEYRDGRINSTSYVENCETSAIGRALGNLGIGATTAIASAEEVLMAIEHQEAGQPDRGRQAPQDALKDAYAEMGRAIEGWCERHGADVESAKAGVRKRPEWESQCKSVDYIRAIAREFADG